MKKLLGIMLISLVILMACEPTPTEIFDNGENVCHLHSSRVSELGGASIDFTHYIEVEDGVIVEIVEIAKYHLGNNPEETLATIYDFFGYLMFDYEREDDTLTRTEKRDLDVILIRNGDLNIENFITLAEEDGWDCN